MRSSVVMDGSGGPVRPDTAEGYGVGVGRVPSSGSGVVLEHTVKGPLVRREQGRPWREFPRRQANQILPTVLSGFGLDEQHRGLRRLLGIVPS